jgi:hypothetical protein
MRGKLGHARKETQVCIGGATRYGPWAVCGLVSVASVQVR